ncbi:hypothetical protein HYV88_05835 [Candidatus Woesearchaeota archaeon]|nr:hypothetical protein [Candidatus Woesearchaeota archaeon]
MKTENFLLIILVGVIFLGIVITDTIRYTGYDTGIVLSKVVDTDCVLNLKEGWNFISFCANVTNKEIISVLSGIGSNYKYIMQWNETNQKFDIYSILSNEKPFNDFDFSKGYFIYLTKDNLNLIIVGESYNLYQKNLIFGWNTPGYVYTTSMSIDDLTRFIQNDFRYIMKWNNIDQKFDIYSPLASRNPFTSINKGEGQFIYIKNNDGISFIY